MLDKLRILKKKNENDCYVIPIVQIFHLNNVKSCPKWRKRIDFKINF